MADAPALLLEGVRKSFGTGVVTEVLRGVDLRVERGEFATLVGPSGSGKSTLLNILGLLDRPTNDRVAVAGQDTAGLDDAALTKLRGQTLGFVFQFHHLLPGLTAAENVMMPMAAARGRMTADLRPRAVALLERVGLGAKADAPPAAMSGVLREFNRELGVAFLIVTHDPRLAARCDRTIELVDGRVVSDRRTAVQGSAGR